MCGSTLRAALITATSCQVYAPSLRRIADELGNSRRRAVPDRSKGWRKLLPADAPDAPTLAKGRVACVPGLRSAAELRKQVANLERQIAELEGEA
jgi:hypothetical protein